MREVDCIIVGQGIAGTLLSFELLEAGLSVLVFNAPNRQSASLVASGVINPVTGRRVVTTWQIEQLLPLATQSYQRISDYLQLPPVARSIEVLSIHGNEQMRQAYEKRVEEGSAYINRFETGKIQGYIKKLSNEAHVISPALLIDLQTLLPAFNAHLRKQDQLIERTFDWSQLQRIKKGKGKATEDHKDEETHLIYTGTEVPIKAKWVIATDGVAGALNPYFKTLHFRYNKGEALIISAPDLPRDYIYKLSYSIVPWGDKDLFWVGSTYQWAFEDQNPTDSFKEAVMNFLDEVLEVPYSVQDHLASIRPASVNRRPFAGFCAPGSHIGLLNGLGTKGCSLAPLLATAWKEHLIKGTPFMEEVALDSQRH